MNEFDGKKFYGFSLQNDPVLSTTTRNFEFKYTRPEHLERVIQKVQHSELAYERNRKKDVFNRLCKAKKITPTTEVSTPYRRDADVETHVSRADKPGRVRNLSDTEINQLIGKVKSYGDLCKQNSTDTYARGKNTTKPMKQTTILKGILRPTVHEFPCGGNIIDPYQCGGRSIHTDGLEVCDENSCDGEMLYSDSTSEDQILCNPLELPHEPLFEAHSVHLTQARREMHSGVSKLPDVPEEDELLASKNVMPTIVEEFRQPQPKWVEISETLAMSAAQLGEIKIQLDTDADTLTEAQPSSDKTERLPTNVTYTMHSQEFQLPLQISAPEMMLRNQPPPPSLPNLALTYSQSSYDDNPSTYDIEDSDLEYEMMGRAEYTKLCGPRPKTEELICNSNHSGGLAEFVEVESEMPNRNVSFLKNVSPIRFSDLTDEREEDKTENQHMKVIIKHRSKKSPSPPPEKGIPTSGVKETKKKITKPKKQSIEDTKQSPRQKSSARGADSSPVTGNSPHTPRSTGRKSTTSKQHKDRAHQTISSNELRTMKNIVLTKSIEDLKMEKMTIFAKMTRMQERIIEILDKLRISLLEHYVPDSHYEKTRRQKNAFEFSVRFSRNFLYPLKGMIEDLRLVSMEQLCSASSNEATQRVLNIFSLVHQSLQTYYKQLRYFLLDQVPQKLNTLIELVATVVNICREKQIFDRNDAIIECLQDRCSKFLGFLEDMHEERFLTARDNYRKASFDKTASNYSLKMFMNDLNMYEPKLVPKNHYNQRRKPKQRRVLKPSATNTKTKLNTAAPLTPKTSNMVIAKPDGDQISTQINELTNSSGLIHSVADSSVPPAEPSMNSEALPCLNQALVEALQTVTKQQMRQVLQPIMQTLGSVLEKKNASKTIEELLSAFSKNLISLAEGEHSQRTNPGKYSAQRDKVRGVEESKAPKQTERQQRNRQDSSNNESTKRHEVAAAFFGNNAPTANASETVICDIDVDDDDDNYYDNDGLENGDGDFVVGADHDDEDYDDDDDDGIGKARDAPTEHTERSELAELAEITETSNSIRHLHDELTGNSKSHNNSKAVGSNIIAFDNCKLSQCDNGGDYDGDDVVSESGSDFVSFEGNSSNFDVVIALKPEKNKVNEQQQAQQQQPKLKPLNSRKEQQQHQKEQQQLEKFQARDLHSQQNQHTHSKQQQQQTQERQPEKVLRERTENYDTHIQQQQKLLLQQIYDEDLLQRQRKQRSAASQNVDSAGSSRNTAEQVIRQSRNLQKQLQQQLEQHQRCIIAQQQQQQLHQQQLEQHKMLEREEQRMLQEQQQQQNQSAQKPLTRKQLQLQAQQQARVAVASRHSSRASSSRPPSSRTSPLPATSRGRPTARAKNPSSNSADMHSERGAKVLKKRRNPLNSPPPAPSVTPSNSARTPRSTEYAAGDSAQILQTPFAPSLRPSFITDMRFGEGGAGGDAGAFNVPDCSEPEMLKMCSKLKLDFFEMMVPLANAFNIAGVGSGAEQLSPKQPRQSKSSMKKSDDLPNRDLIEALTNCLFNYSSAGPDNSSKAASASTVKGDEEEVRDTDCPIPITLHTGESPYEKLRLQEMQQRLHKQRLPEFQKEQRREERKKNLCKESNKEECNDWLHENSADELSSSDADCKPSTITQSEQMDSNNPKPIVSPCALWNASNKPTKEKKDLHIEKLVAERDHFLRLCSKNRFYANPNFNQPWNVFSNLANRLSNEIVGMIEEDFSIGVSKFVEDFLDNETKI